jgi:hypothetical protein
MGVAIGRLIASQHLEPSCSGGCCDNEKAHDSSDGRTNGASAGWRPHRATAVGRRRRSGGSDARGFPGAVPSHQNLSRDIFCEGAVGNSGTENVLSLPPEYRPSCAAVHESVVHLGIRF